jgi:hypothetical protein
VDSQVDTNVSETHTVSIFRAEEPTRCHNPNEKQCHLLCHENLKSHTKVSAVFISYGCESWSLTLRENTLSTFTNKVLKTIFRSKKRKYRRIGKIT